MPPSQRLGTTAADALDDMADDLEFAASAHASAAARWAGAIEAHPGEVAPRFELARERAREELARAFAKSARERARVIRAHDEASTVRTGAPPLRPWWRWWR